MADSAKARQQIGKPLGRQIAERRRAIGWTQEELAERLGVDAETVSRFERGAAVPSLPRLADLARLLKTRAATLLSDASVEPTDQARRISAWLEGLPARDREYALDQLKRLCDHLRRRN